MLNCSLFITLLHKSRGRSPIYGAVFYRLHVWWIKDVQKSGICIPYDEWIKYMTATRTAARERNFFWEWHIFVFKFIINAYFETYMRSPEGSARWNIVSRLAEICIISNLPTTFLVLLTVPPVSTASAKYTAASVALNVWRSIYVLRSMYWTLEWLGSATYSSQWIGWLDVVLTPSTPAVSNCCC